MLDDRKAAILGALVEGHIATGAPVSSGAILDRSGLDCSSATIRNEMVVLERLGLVAQPHTSAGRVPTDRGYRYYVDHLSPTSVRSSTRGRIESFFGTVHAQFSSILRETSDMLSEITHYPAVVLGPGLRGHVVRDVRLLAVEPEVIAVVVLTDSGRVHQSVVRPPHPVDADDVAAAADVLEGLVGRELNDESLRMPEVEAPAAAATLAGLTLAAISGALDHGREFYVGGASRMVELWEDLAKLHRVLALLERETSVLELLDDRAEGTSVRLGPEIHAAEQDLAVVSSAFLAAGARGRVGVLGPMRMDYRRSIRVVEEVSDALGDSLNH
jgi:heat-inducible transcriptional repressor